MGRHRGGSAPVRAEGPHRCQHSGLNSSFGNPGGHHHELAQHQEVDRDEAQDRRLRAQLFIT